MIFVGGVLFGFGLAHAGFFHNGYGLALAVLGAFAAFVFNEEIDTDDDDSE